MKFLSLGALWALAFCTGLMAQTHSGAEARRFSRGVPSDSTNIPNPSLYQSVVIPADQQRGVELDPSGNNAATFGYPDPADVAKLPWFCRIQRPTLYHLATNAQDQLAYASFENPIAAFGELAGGTPLYLNRDYRFGAFAGFRNNAATPTPLPGTFRIRAYSKASLASGQTNVAPASQTTFELPWPGDGNWNQFLLDGARKNITFLGLTTTVEIVGGALQAGSADQWNTWNDPYVITHRAANSDYFYVVEYKGWSTAGANYPMVTTGTPDITNGATFSPLYTLDFTVQPAWRSTFIHAPHFNGEAVPSSYYGRALSELQAQWGFSPVTPEEGKKLLKGSANLDNSPELRAHPILDDFVADMGNDPIALANYVSNEIALTDPVSYNEEGDLGDASIGTGGVNRGALATFLEKQGNPWEQCALLVYLLRKANVGAVYCEPENNKLGMLDTQLSKLLRMQVKGAQTPDGETPMPEIVPTNYPWVAAWIESENRWVHLFPWLKDTEAIEGGNLYDQFPSDTKTGAAWVRKYIQGDTAIVPSQVAVYQQDAGSNGLAVVEAEGFHEHTPKNGKKWEPLDDTTPSGYSGVSWMRPMPEAGTDNSNAGFAATSPRLDYQINFTKTGTHYVWVRGYGGTGNDRVHVGVDGAEVTTADRIGDFGAAFQWRNKDTANVVATINVTTTGLHTVNVWMARDGFRFDKLLLTTNASYDPSTVNSGNGPAISKQSPVEPNVPSHLFQRYARANLGANVSFDTLGMQFRDRRTSRASWDEFPKPFQLASGNHLVFDKLADRSDTFDTVRVQLWSDKNNDGVYNAGTDGTLLDTGEWLSAELHNRRFYASTRKTGASAEQLRLYLAPYRASATGTGNYAGTNKLQEQLLTATLGSTDNTLQFEITHRRQKKVSKFGVVTADVVAGGTGYTSAPAVTIAAPPVGTGHRTATATATVSGGKVTGFTLTDPGYGYATAPAITLTGGGGSGASAKANLEDVIAKWTHPLGVSVSQLTVQKPTIQKGDLAAICLNFGRVTDPMLRVHAEDFWSFERSLQVTPSLKDDPNFQEKMQSTSAYLMGMAYYERVSRFKETDERLHKARVLSMYAAGLSKLAAYRDSTTGAPIYPSGSTYPYLPVMQMAAVDMFFLNAAYASNASVHADSGLPFTESSRDFWHLLIGEISAQEHAIINDYYSESAAISTIRLLHRAKTMTGGVRRLTKLNYVSEGNLTYTYGTLTKALKDWDPSMWSAITGAFAGDGGDFTEVYVTPGPVRSASASYTGMGAMVFSTNQYSALISGNLNLANGGSGSTFSAPRYSPPSLASNTLTYTSTGYNLSYRPPATSSNPVVAPATSTLWNVPSTISSLNTSSFTPSTYQTTSWSTSASLLGLSSGGWGDYYSASASRGSTGSTSFFGAVGSAISSVAGWVSDPVNVVTGEFYHDAVDLTLPGPFPLAIRRNYSSLSLSENEFGHGWKLAYFPYLVVGDNALIYGAEMDGSVIAYRQNGTNPNLYEPKPADNPSLKNLHGGGAGSTGNPLNNRLIKSTEGADTIYTLTGPHGHTRRFKVRQFPIGTGGSQVTRSRPYLESWKDANGNTLTFTFDSDSASPEYGLLTRISANNGNFLGFTYDVYGHIVEAWTGDGRRVTYSYDAQGDLRSVTLPDGAVHQYDYKQETTTAGGESVQTSTHLIIRETKPNGRILENDYDAQRRVTEQRAVVGTFPNPVRNATFIYANTQNTTAGDPNKGTWTGTTTVRDAYNRDTVFSYANSLVTSEDDPETPPEARAWYGATETGNGAYPRSLKSVTDRRGVVTFFKYDARGNLVEKSLGTDAAPADLDGDGTAASGEKAVSSWTYTALDLPATATEPSGILTKWFYEDAAYPYLATRIETHAQGQLVSQTTRAFYEVGTTAFGLLQSERLAAGSPDEALTEWQHDTRGFPSRRTSHTGTGDPIVVTDLKHNLRGELTEEKDALNRKWTYAHDAMGRRIAAERRDAGGTLLSWDYVYYNLNGEPEWTDGARYNPEDTTWSKYDGHGRLTEKLVWRSQSRSDGQGLQAPVGDALIATTLNKYDLFNNLIETRTPRGHSVAMGYDGIGRLTSRQFYEGIKDNGGVLKASEAFTYEPGGEVQTHTGVLGGITTTLYNARGQLRKRTHPDGSVEEWRYYPDGRLFKEILRNGSAWETTYNDPARTVTRTLKAGGSPIKTQVKVFDRRGNCISETADGHTFTKTYDGLNRLKTATGPGATATSAQQTASYAYPDAAGREERVTNGLNETTTTLRDALGRVESVEVRDAANTLVSVRTYAYSPDHAKVTETAGSGAGAIVTETWSDHAGQPAVVRKADGTFELFRYDNGGLLLQHQDRAGRLTNYQRDWRGSLTSETRPGNVAIGYVHDAAGNLLERQMPGGAKEVNTFDAAGRMTSSKLTQGGSTTRLVSYAYHPGGHQWAGLLNTATDARGIVTTMTYDAALRAATASSAGADPEDNLTRTLGYNERDQVTSIAETGLNGSTTVTRGFDGYGVIGSETVSIGGTALSTITQTWNAAGRRSGLESGTGFQPVFAHNAAGQMNSVTVGGHTYSATFGTNGLLTSRTNPFRSVAVQTRDSLGRITDQRTTVSETLVLKETVPTWNNLDKVNGIYAERSGAGAWNESRDFLYDNSARLIYEEFSPSPSASDDYLLTAYDGPTWGQGATGGIGVRTHTQRGGDSVLLHEVPSVATFSRVASENIGGSQPRTVPLSGVALGADKVSLTLDGRDLTPVNFPGWQSATGNWTANATVAPGVHRLTATATHPSGWVAPAVTNNFTVLPRAESVANTYDEMGNVATRTWTSGKVQTLTWDPRGRLVKVVQTGMQPFTWTALYDGLDRRIKTTYTPQGSAMVTTNSVFDPQVEFLELGLAINGAWNWKVYGPDLSGNYGGLQGLGGLEAVIGSDNVARGIVNDWWGNTVGHVAAPGAAMTWSPAQFLAWGPAPGWGTPPIDGTKPLHELLGYRGLTLDPPGYVQQGLRPYDPQTGRWLSPDPVGHAGSLSLYDYCDNDPLNVFDPDGRFGKGVSSGWSGSIAANAPNSSAFTTGMMFGGGARGGVEGFGIGVQNVSGYTSYQSHLTMFEGDRYAATNAAWNPAYMGMRGFTEAGGGTGMQPHNLGQSLSTGQRVWSGVEGGLGAVGTVGVGAGVARVATISGVTAPAENFAARTYLNEVGKGEYYSSFSAGTARLNVEIGGRNLYRATDSPGSAKFGEFAAVQRPSNPAQAVAGNALNPSLYPAGQANTASQLYQVQTRFGLSVEGKVAPQGVGYPGGNIQVFQTTRRDVGLSTWSNVTPLQYGQ
jgi:RHS repeat-associated protein